MTQTFLKGQQAFNSDGWETIQSSLTYASATTINSSVDLTGVLQKGDKIKITQTTIKYFYVVSLTSTVITVTGGSDYSVANAAITLPYYSKVTNPQGFPQHFAYTPTLKGTPDTSSLTTNVAKFAILGNMVNFNIYAVLSKTGSPSGTFGLSLPVNALSLTNFQITLSGAEVASGGNPATASRGMPYISQSALDTVRFLTSAGAAELTWTTAANGDYILVNGSYPF